MPDIPRSWREYSTMHRKKNLCLRNLIPTLPLHLKRTDPFRRYRL